MNVFRRIFSRARSRGLASTILLGAFAGVSLQAQAELYKWEDKSGMIHYSDVVPPEHSGHKRETLSPHGVVVDVVEAERTLEQLERDARLADLRAEQHRMLAQQAAKDRVLMRTFSNEQDLIMAHDGKLSAIDVIIGATGNNIRRLNEQLRKLQKSAADKERAGRTVSAKLRREIMETQRQIEQNDDFILSKQEEKIASQDRFTQDLNRFRELKDLERENLVGGGGGNLDPNALAVVGCRDTISCGKAWSLAQIYVRKHATTRIQLVTDAILMTTAPDDDEDIGITVTRIPGKDSSAELFLDLQCKNSPMGEDLCSSSAAIEIRNGFKPFIASNLK